MKLIKENFMSRVGVSKEEYGQLVEYYTGLKINNLTYDIYKYGTVELNDKKISFLNMKKEELEVYNIVVKSCLILN